MLWASDYKEKDRMREILFKAKRVDNDEWIEGYLLKDGVTGQYFIHAKGNSVNESDKVNEEGFVQFVAFEVVESTICQHTGLTDKNRKKIFDNDIFKHYNRTDFLDFESYETGVVKWDEIKCRYVNYRVGTNETFNLNCACDYEVIGNIFDNPELLESGADHE